VRVQRMGAIAALGLVALVGAVGCGGSDRGGAQSASAPEVQNQAPADLDAPGGAGDGAQKPAGLGAPAVEQMQASQRHVVRTAQLSIEVEDVYQAARRVYEVGARFSGFVADERTDDRGASIELKVAADELDTALAELSAIGTKVVNRGQQAMDVTDQVVDVEARIASQRASVERVRALLGNATTISEIVQVESELTRRQADLESLERRAAALNSQTELATVTVSLAKVDGVATDDEDDMGFLAGLGAGWKVFLASAMVLLTVLGALLPFAMLLAIPLAVIVVVLRRRRAAEQTPTAPAAGS
jgi:hypothetical protein